MAATKQRKSPATSTPSGQDYVGEADAKLAAAEARVEDLNHRIFVDMPAEQSELQDSIDRAEQTTNYAAAVEARSALDAAKRRRNACIDELDTATGEVTVARAQLEAIRHTEHRRETLGRAESVVTASHAELLEEQRQIPVRLAKALRDVDIAEVQALRRRLDELPDQLYAARLVEVGGAIDRLRTQAAEELAAADALAPELEAAEAHLREAQAARDRIVAQVSWHRADAREASHNAAAREREIDILAAEAARTATTLNAPLVRSVWQGNAAG